MFDISMNQGLRKNRRFVVGNSILQGINIRVQDFLGDIAEMCGLKLVGIYRLRNKRVGDSITGSSVRGRASKARLDESAVVVRKP